MTSGLLITLFIPVCLVVFAAWEFVQLYRRRSGNKSALTNSQYVVKRAKAGSKFWRVYIYAFPIFIILVGVVLIFHWEAPCINWGWFCWIDF